MEELVEALKDFQKPALEPSFQFPWQEPTPTVQSFLQLTENLLSAFQADDPSRSKHSFPLLATGSGMGKTRFGWEIHHRLDEFLSVHGLGSCHYIHLDFNGGGYPIGTHDLSQEPDCALAIRIASRELFRIPPSDLYNKLYPQEFHLFSLSAVLPLIARSHRTASGDVVNRSRD